MTSDNGVIINIHERVGRYDEDHDAHSCTTVIKGECMSNEGDFVYPPNRDMQISTLTDATPDKEK